MAFKSDLPPNKSNREYAKKPRLSSGAWLPAVPAGLVLLPLRPGVDEAAVEGRGVLRGELTKQDGLTGLWSPPRLR